MKVKKLIEILQDFPEDMEVNIWNGFVDDYQPIDDENPLFVEEYYRYSKDYFILGLKMDYLKKHNMKDSFENPIPLEDLKKINLKAKEMYEKNKNNLVKKHKKEKNMSFDSWYDTESIKKLIIQPGRANKTYSDRVGTLYY